MIKIKVLILPKFDSDTLTEDYAGEARLFVDAYLRSSEEIRLKNGRRLLYNADNGVALGLCSIGKVCAASYVSTLLSDERFDFSDTLFLCVGCGGSASGYSTMGDVCIASDIVDYDLGFETIDIEDGRPKIKWYYEDLMKGSCHKKLNEELVSRVYELTKEIRLSTTDITKHVMERNFPGEEWALRNPRVILGTMTSSDTFWKGEAGHDKANMLCEFYGCTHPFAMTEMEDIACAVVCDQFGMLDRFIDLRVSVNLDVFKDKETPESIWATDDNYLDRVQTSNEETLDIFPVAMENLFKVGSAIIDNILKEKEKA